VAHHCAGQGHPLSLAAGELARLALEQPLDAEHLRRPLDLTGDALSRRALRLEGKGDVPGHGEVRVQRVALEDHGDLPGARRQLVHHAATDQDVAGGLGFQSGDHPEQGGLATARWPEEHQELALVDHEVDTVHCRVAGELLA